MVDPLTLIKRLFQREKRYTNDPADAGGRTDFGISERAHPEAWIDGGVSEAEALNIYLLEYFKGPGLDKIEDNLLTEQVFDYAVHAGALTSIKLLQQVVGAAEDGHLGPETLEKINTFPAGVLYGLPLPSSVALNLAFDTARIESYGHLVKEKPINLKFLSGWLKRATSFRSL